MKNLEVLLIRHTKVTEDYEGLVEIQYRNWPCFIEKIIAVTEDLNKTDLSDKETKIVKKITKNYKICKRVYKVLYTLISECFQEYLSTLEHHELVEINGHVKTNGRTLNDIKDYTDSFELLKSMDFFFYLNDRLPATNGVI